MEAGSGDVESGQVVGWVVVVWWEPDDRGCASIAGKDGEMRFLVVWLLSVLGSQDDAVPTRDEEVALEFVLPEGWTLHPQSGRQGDMILRMYAAESALRRFVVLDFDPEEMSELAERAQGLGDSIGATIPVSATTVGGLEGEELTYDSSGTRTVERGVLREGRYQVLQVSAPLSDWNDPELAAALDRVYASVRFLAGERPGFDPAAFDGKTPDEVRAARARDAPALREFAIRHHDVRLDIDPRAGTLTCRDEFTLEALVDGLEQIPLVQSCVEVDAIEAEGAGLEFERVGGALVVHLPAPLARGDSLTLSYRAHADDYFYSYPQELIAEIEMLGQVRENSSFSSHVHYYPVDADNDATVAIAITVPRGFTAVSGGDRSGAEAEAEAEEGEWVTTSFETELRHPRILPLGFAVGRYESYEDATEEGLSIEFHCLPEQAALGESYLDFARRCADFFSELKGPLPWDRVAFAVVEPARLELGVSLPGLILLSPSYLGDLDELEIDGSTLSSREMGRFLIVADELAHQWNAYSAPLPNELAEGISTYTNLLVIEREADHGEYLEGVAFCSRVYLDHVAPAADRAVADPALYSSDGYRLIAFCKVAAVMHDLRRRVGDEAFFRGWRRAFDTVDDRATAYETFQEAFEHASGEDLRAYFDSWFFRAGRPRVHFEWQTEEVDGGCELEVILTQKGEGPPFEFEVDVELENPDGSRERRRLSARSLVQSERWKLSVTPVAVHLDPDGVALIERRER